MPETKEVSGRLYRKERLNVSTSGNPRWDITLDNDGRLDTYTTLSDASVNYEVDNYRCGPRVTLTLNRGGRVIDMTYTNGRKA